MLKKHLITVDPGGSRAEIEMACGKKGRIRHRYQTEVTGDTWKGAAIAPTGFSAVAEIDFFPDPRRYCGACIKRWKTMD